MILKYPETFEKIISEDITQSKIGFSLDDKKFIKNVAICLNLDDGIWL